MDTEERLSENSSNRSGGAHRDTDQGGTVAFFSSPELVQRLDLLRHLTESSELIPLVKGPEGSGKSSLIRQFSESASNNWVIARIEANPMMQPDQLLAALAETYSSVGGVYSLEGLLQRFGYLRQDGFLPVVIVDDAHLLPEATIITLLRMHERRQDENILVRILLFAQSDIDDLLKTPQIQAMNILSLQTLDMPRLTEDQTGQFVKQLLMAEDQSGRLELSSSRIEKIFHDSEGLPGRIVEQVLASVSFGAVKRRRAGKLRVVSPLTIAGLLSIGVILLLMLIFQDSINALFGIAGESERPMSPASSGSGKVVPLQLPAEPKPEMSSPEPSAVTAPAVPVPVPEQMPAAETPAAEQPAVEAREQAAEPVPVELPVVTQDVAMAEAEQAAEKIREESSAEKPAVTAPVEVAPEAAPGASVKQEKQPVTEAVAEKAPKAVEQKVATAEQKKAVAVAEKVEPVATAEQKKAAAVAEKVEPVAKREKPKPVVESAKPKPVVRPGSEAWLLQQNPKAYTLQLIGLQDEAGVSRFLERYKLPGQTAYFRSTRQGKPWFAVLYGIYPDRDAAVAARAGLPGSLKRTDVWPRSLGSVQKEIRSR